MDTDTVALWQKPPNEPHDSLHVTALSPLYARYTTSVDTAPAASIAYVSICKQKQSQNRFCKFNQAYSICLELYMHMQNIYYDHDKETWSRRKKLQARDIVIGRGTTATIADRRE